MKFKHLYNGLNPVYRGNNQIEVEKRTDSKIDPTYEMIKEELTNLRAKHFDTYKINKVEVETISRSILPKINSLLKSDDSGKRLIVNDFIQSIEIYGLKSCVDTMRSKIIEVIYDERIKNEPQSKELSGLMSWQTSYFVRFIGEDAILRIDPKLNLIADEKKITINGRKEAVERYKNEFFLILDYKKTYNRLKFKKGRIWRSISK